MNRYLLAMWIVALSFFERGEVAAQPTRDLRSRFDSARAEYAAFEKLHGRFVRTRNIDMHYLEWGNPANTPLIWVHGSFTNAYEIAGIAGELVAKGYYLLAIDYYGHGQTRIPGHEVSLYHVADDIRDLMDHKKINRAIIGGWSRGGIVATAFYDSYPERVLGLVLEDGGSVSTNTHYHHMTDVQLAQRMQLIFKGKQSYPAFDSQYEAYQAFYDPDGTGTQFSLLAWITTDSAGKWTIGPGIEELFHMKTSEQFLTTILRPTSATLFAESMSFVEPRIVYRNLAVPMLILDPVSDDDLFPYEQQNEALKNQHPGLIIYRRYDQTGHNIHYERPKEFVDDVVKFLGVVRLFWN